jgi:hypothetical protein
VYFPFVNLTDFADCLGKNWPSFFKNSEPNKFQKTNKFRLALSTPDQGFRDVFNA